MNARLYVDASRKRQERKRLAGSKPEQTTQHFPKQKQFKGVEMGIGVVVYDKDGEEVFDFGVSYTNYHKWCEDLAKFAGWPLFDNGYGEPKHIRSALQADSGPFCELLKLSDCDDPIDAGVCAKLAMDFATHQDRLSGNDDSFAYRYRQFQQALAIASYGGRLRLL